MKWFPFIFLLSALMSSPSAYGKGSGLSAGAMQGSKPLEVRGQNRALSMMQVGRNDKTKIGFVQPRKNYRPQIIATPF